MILIEDIYSRSVHWFLFPLLTVLLVCLHYNQYHTLETIWEPASINMGFMLLQLLLLSAYFSIRNKKLVNITHGLLGLGDILFLLSIAFYFSVLGFLFFYIISLLLSLLFWIIWQWLVAKRDKAIPLAGIQAFLFIPVVAGAWWFKFFDLANDSWLFNLIIK